MCFITFMHTGVGHEHVKRVRCSGIVQSVGQLRFLKCSDISISGFLSQKPLTLSVIKDLKSQLHASQKWTEKFKSPLDQWQFLVFDIHMLLFLLLLYYCISKGR